MSPQAQGAWPDAARLPPARFAPLAVCAHQLRPPGPGAGGNGSLGALVGVPATRSGGSAFPPRKSQRQDLPPRVGAGRSGDVCVRERGCA